MIYKLETNSIAILVVSPTKEKAEGVMPFFTRDPFKITEINDSNEVKIVSVIFKGNPE